MLIRFGRWMEEKGRRRICLFYNLPKVSFEELLLLMAIEYLALTIYMSSSQRLHTLRTGRRQYSVRGGLELSHRVVPNLFVPSFKMQQATESSSLVPHSIDRCWRD
jgi:hypothetical protein